MSCYYHTLFEKLLQKSFSVEIEIDLADKVLRYAGKTVPLCIPEGRRQALLNGTWDALTVLPKNEKGIKKIIQKLVVLYRPKT